jgi:hypothetical protein
VTYVSAPLPSSILLQFSSTVPSHQPHGSRARSNVVLPPPSPARAETMSALHSPGGDRYLLGTCSVAVRIASIPLCSKVIYISLSMEPPLARNFNHERNGILALLMRSPYSRNQPYFNPIAGTFFIHCLPSHIGWPVFILERAVASENAHRTYATKP